MKQEREVSFTGWRGLILRASKSVCWWAFRGCLVWPRGMTLRAKFLPSRFLSRMFFRHVARPWKDWFLANGGKVAR